jgi:flagellar motility protein MotE (MotC chaperone)
MAERIRFQTRPQTGYSSGSYERKLAESIEARDKLLKERPSLQAYQAEIDRALQNVHGYEDRMAVLSVMMEAKLHELRESFAALKSVAGKYGSVLNVPQPDDRELAGLTGSKTAH